MLLAEFNQEAFAKTIWEKKDRRKAGMPESAFLETAKNHGNIVSYSLSESFVGK